MLWTLTMPDPAARLESAARDHRAALVRFAARMLRDAAEAEDVVQAALARAVAAVRDGVVPEQPRAWLFAIVLREVHHVLDRRRVRRDRPVPAPPPPRGPHAHAERAELVRIVLDEIQSLEEPYRQILLLRHDHQLGPEEIARVLDLPVGTVKSYTARALARLQSRLAGLLDREVDG